MKRNRVMSFVLCCAMLISLIGVSGSATAVSNGNIGMTDTTSTWNTILDALDDFLVTLTHVTNLRLLKNSDVLAITYISLYNNASKGLVPDNCSGPS